MPALSASASERNATSSRIRRQPDDGADEQRQPRGGRIALVDRRRRGPADVHAGRDAVAQRVHERLGLRVLRRGRGRHGQHGGVAGAVERGRADRGDAGHRREPRGSASIPARVAGVTSAASTSGPARPARSPRSTSSYAARVVVPCGSLPWSG